MPGKYPKLTDKQRIYAMETLMGKDPLEAATLAGYASPRSQYASVESKPAVQSVIGFARYKKDKKLDVLTERLEKILKNFDKVEWKGSDMIAALKLLAQLHELMPDSKKPNTINLNYFDVKDANPQQLWLKLQEIQEARRLEQEAIDSQVVDIEQEEAINEESEESSES